MSAMAERTPEEQADVRCAGLAEAFVDACDNGVPMSTYHAAFLAYSECIGMSRQADPITLMRAVSVAAHVCDGMKLRDLIYGKGARPVSPAGWSDSLHDFIVESANTCKCESVRRPLRDGKFTRGP
jgi:hypothetical protein